MADAANVKANELESNATIENRITATKTAVETAIIKYNSGAKTLKVAAEAKAKCEKKHEAKANAKNAANLEKATATYDAEYSDMVEISTVIESSIEQIKEDWNKLISQIELMKGSKPAKKEAKKLEVALSAILSKKKKGDDILASSGIELVAPVVEQPEEVANPVVEQAEATSASVGVQYDSIAQPRYYDPYAPVRPSVNIAPVNIDISTAVEKAVSQAMNKLSVALNRRMEEFFATYNPPAPTQTAAATVAQSGVSSETVDLQGKIADDEKFILDKLTALIANIKELNTAMATVTTGYAQIDAKVKESVELQKQTNDMQRHTLREQQGVQVNQRVINKDQLAIAEEQAAIADAQKNVLDDQKRLASAQSAMAENQRAIIDTQNSLEEAMKIIMQEQKKLINAHQAIATENAKQLDTQKAISDKQTEISDAQKEMLASQKLILKEQKNMAAKAPKKADEEA